MRVLVSRVRQNNKDSYIVSIRPRRVIVGLDKGHPCGVHPIDRLPVKSLGSEAVDVELPTRFESRHSAGKRG